MDPITIMAILDAAITIVEKAVPKIQEMVNNGEISQEQQAELADKYARLKASGFAFTRPPGT